MARFRQYQHLTIRFMLRFIAGVVGLAVAARYLLPGQWLLTIQSQPAARTYEYQRVVFWLVLVIGAVVFIVKIARR